MKIFLKEKPRTFIVVDTSYSLIIRHPNPTYKHHEHVHRHDAHHYHSSKELRNGQLNNNKVIVEFIRTELISITGFTDITPNKVRNNKLLIGFIGFLNVKGNIHLGFITRSTKVASPRLGETVHMINDVDFYCLNNDQFDSWMNRNEEDLALTNEELELSSIGYPAGSVKKLLSLGNFYFSKEFDVTTTLQERGFAANRSNVATDRSYSERFCWNAYMVSDFLDLRERLSIYEREQFDRAGFLTVITRGYTKSVNVTLTDDLDALLTLVSKQSCCKNGPLFGEWGCDDRGNVSNYLESEVIIYTELFCFSYIIVRGNIPSFWELQNRFSKKNIIYSKKSKKIVFTRSFEASQHAFNLHFDTLGQHFGDIHIVNCLLQDEHSYKGQLNQNFKEHLQSLIRSREAGLDQAEELEQGQDAYARDAPASIPLNNYRLTITDLPISTAYMKRIGYNGSNPLDVVLPLTNAMLDFGAMFFDLKRLSYIGRQLGVFRVNSFDCLTKANFISKIISQEVIDLALRDMGIERTHDLHVRHSQLWAENDDMLKKLAVNFLSNTSKIQSSSSSNSKNSLKQQMTRKYLNVVGEVKPSEIAMLKLLGRLQDQDGVRLYNPFHQYVGRELKKRASEYSYRKDIRIFASTFNVNGTVSSDPTLKEWLFSSEDKVNQDYDLVCVGFEEIVELTPGKMINVKSDNLVKWEQQIKSLLDKHGIGKDRYLPLWSWQMGGLAIMLFIKETQIGNITNLEGSVKKTGLGGMSANKGGIAISFNYSNTLICFVCSHLAAGLNNVDERHQNYKAIAKGIRFSKHKKIRDHDAVIWMGDFNYRIALQIEQVKALIERKNYQKLFEYDQLNKQMADGETFPFYGEMEITFAPTYKFDNNSNVYDTSEKQRIPAWTDRVLSMSKGKILRQELYNSADKVLFSDHRPVYAIFNASVIMVNEVAKKAISSDIYDNYRRVVGDINVLITANNVDRFVDDISDNFMPPPSSDSSKWWLDGGILAKVNIKELQEDWSDEGNQKFINPKHPANPFISTLEPEFITKLELTNRIMN